MTLSEFQASISRTYREGNKACHGLGIAGEAGEVADEIKKHLFHDSDAMRTGATLATRRANILKELGDVLWYVAAVASDWDLTLDEIAQGNIDKLAARYPSGFEKGGGVREEVSAKATTVFEGRCEKNGKVGPGAWMRCVRPEEHTGSHRAPDGSVFE